MLAPRTAFRAHRAICVGRSRFSNNIRRYASDTTAKPAASGAVAGGLIGGGITLAVAYGWYHFSGAKTAVQTAHTAKSYVDSAINSVKVQLPDGDANASDALKVLRDTANKYAAFIPGGREYVDSAFNDIDAIRKQHGDEVDKIVREAYADLRETSKKGLSFETASETVEVLMKHLSRLSSLAGDAAQDILDQHPQLKEKVGGSLDQLNKLGDRYGPEAKKQVDEVQQQIRDITKSGLQWDTVEKVKKLVQERTEKIRSLGEQALNQDIDEMKPMLDKNPKLKQLVQDNMQALKNGNVMEVVSKIRDATSSGNTADLEKYIKQMKEQGSGQPSQWLGAIPDGSQILSQFQSLQEIATTKGQEAEGLLKETISEIKQVLDDKLKKADQIRKPSGKGKDQ